MEYNIVEFGNAGEKQLLGPIVVNSNLVLENGPTLNVMDNHLIDVKGDLSLNGSFVNGTDTAKVRMSGNSFQVVSYIPSTSFHRFEVAGSNGIGLTGDISIEDSLIVIDSLVTNNNNIDVEGQVDLQGFLDIGQGDLNFVGTTVQSFTNDNINGLFNVNINNSAGVTLVDTMVVYGYITMNSGSLTTNDKLTLGSNSLQTGALIDNVSTAGSGGSVMGNITVERFADATGGFWDYLGSPVLSKFALDFTSNSNAIYEFEEDKTGTINKQGDLWTNIASAGTFSMDNGVGIAVFENTKTYSVSGQPNNGLITIPLTHTNTRGWGDDTLGWNLIGNPYPSPIDWDVSSGWVKTDIHGTIYAWNGSQYVTWNGSTGALSNGILGSMQGFFVKTNSTSSILQINNDARISNVGSNNSFYRLNKVEPEELHIEVTNNGYKDDVYVVLDPDTKKGFDTYKDSYKLPGIDQAPKAYTKEGHRNLAVNELPYPFTYEKVPFGLENGNNKKYSLEFNFSDTYDADYEVYFEDVNKFNLIKINPDTTIELDFENYGNDKPEFNLVFVNSVVTTISEYLGTEEISNPIKVYSNKKSVFISSSHEGNHSVNIFDSKGTLIYVEDYTNIEVKEINLSNVTSGTYIIQVVGEHELANEKVILY